MFLEGWDLSNKVSRRDGTSPSPWDLPLGVTSCQSCFGVGEDGTPFLFPCIVASSFFFFFHKLSITARF